MIGPVTYPTVPLSACRPASGSIWPTEVGRVRSTSTTGAALSAAAAEPAPAPSATPAVVTASSARRAPEVWGPSVEPSVMPPFPVRFHFGK